MSQQYQVLARKYRPKNFHELIGQTHVSQALINAIDYNRLHHAYLFTGTRGVGKTTIARILAKCLNCDTGVTSTPCGVCDNCVAIDQGRFIDLIEIDAASRTKVEDTRELLDNVPYAPSQGRYKVYLIDEVHMLSTHSFNALLKTLEEPPEHVKFLLATTDPQKLPITIISRCLQFVLRPLPQTLLSEHLAHILTQEQVDYTQPALWQLASAAKGSVRDALSLTDQAIAFGQGALDDVTVNAMLGLIDAADLVSLITDIYNHDKSAVAAHIEQMRAQMVDATSMFDGLAELLHQLALTQLLPEVALNVNESQAQDIQALAQLTSPDVLQLYYEIVVQAREGIKLASTPMQALEMCILRLLAFRPLPVDEILDPVPPVTIDTPISHTPHTPTSDTAESTALDSTSHVSTLHEPQAYSVDSSSNSHKDAINEMIETTDSEHYSAPHIAQSETQDSYQNDDVSAYDNQENNQGLMESVAYSVEEELSAPILADALISDFGNVDSNEIVPQEAEFQEAVPQEVEFQLNAIPQEPTSGLEGKDTIEEAEVNTTIESEPLEPAIGLSQDNAQPITNIDDPRKLLYCPPQELTGEWTPEKWDYWLQTARASNSLASDQLALARQGMMTGQCNGESTFVTGVDSRHLQSTFQELAAKLQSEFPQAKIDLQVDSSVMQDENKTPERRQYQRTLQATALAESMLLESPVMQYLSERNEGKMGKIKLVEENRIEY